MSEKWWLDWATRDQLTKAANRDRTAPDQRLISQAATARPMSVAAWPEGKELNWY